MTFGLKKTIWSSTSYGKTTKIQILSKEFISAKFVGIGAYQHREWKTRKGAERAAKHFAGAEVFEITDTLNY